MGTPTPIGLKRGRVAGASHAFCRVALSVLLGTSVASSLAQQPTRDPLADITAALRAQDFTAALQRCKGALEHSPRDPRLWTLQALSFQGLHRSPEAFASFDKALSVAPGYVPALQGEAQLGYATHSPRTQAILERLLQLQPEDQVAHAMLGELSFTRKDCPAAIANFSKAAQAIAQRPDVLMQYSSCLVQTSQFEQAATVFQQVHDLVPNDASVRYDLALAQFRAGHASEAKSTLDPSLSSAEPPEDDLTLGAEIAEAQGQTQRALDLLRQAITLHPRETGAYLDFVNLACQHASLQVGLDVVNLGLKQLPEAAELYFARGVLLCQLGKVDDGFVDFRRANQLDPKLSFVGVAEGIAQSQTHHSAAALAQFKAEVKQHPENPLAWYLLAEALSEQGPTRGTPAFKEAVSAAEKAAQLNPKRVEPHDLLASLYLQAEDPQAAITASHAALAIDPQDTQALYHLIMAVRKTDQKAELPDLVKRLMLARQQTEARAEQSRPHLLVESTAAGAGQQSP